LRYSEQPTKVLDVDRDGYLLRGRRVLIADLVQSGLLNPGTELVFKRPRLGTSFTAVVTDDGRLRVDGRPYPSPSSAATAAAGGSLDGWHAWQVAPNGEFLDTLRQRLLDQVAESQRARTGDIDDADNRDAQSHHEFLKDAREQAEKGVPRTMSVRSLLAQWNADGRTQAASEQLAADLENHGLMTEPPFLRVGLDSNVTIVERPVEPVDALSTDGADKTADEDADTGLTLGNIPSANLGVTSISPQSTYEQAVTLMLLNDYSQLAVMTGPRAVPRAVTWQSIAQERYANPDGGLAGAIVDASTRHFETDLVDVLPLLEREDFVFVKDSTNTITGIVTTSDVVRAYGQLATPFFLIGELDRTLRRTLAQAFSLDQVRGICNPNGSRIQSFDDLTMGDYQTVLSNQGCWSSLDWPLDRTMFIERLDELRQLRNDLVHFNPDPIPRTTVERVKHMIQLLKVYGGI